MHRPTLAAAVTAALAFASNTQAAFLIDSFDFTQQLVIGDANGAFSSKDTAEGEAVGNNRDVQVWRDSASGLVLVDTMISEDGMLSYTSSRRAEGHARLSWDGPDGRRVIWSSTDTAWAAPALT